MQPSIAILGAGSMGEIFARGLVRAGWFKGDIVLAARREERAREVEDATGLTTTTDVAAAVTGREVLVISVKPSDIPTLIEQLRPVIEPDQLILSLAAGVPTRLYEEALGEIAVVRAMPNTPSAVDEGMTAYCGGRFSADGALGKANAVLAAVGRTMQLPEDLLDAVTALSGTGPAYLYLLAEAMVEAGIREGLPRHAAEKLVEQTMKGSGTLISASEMSPFELRAQVTSPGGTTAAAMHVLEEGGFRALVDDAVRAAANRSRDLGRKAAGKGDDR
jgi:pyrroline-5-carboxylate reductase